MRPQNSVLCVACITFFSLYIFGCAGLPKNGQTERNPAPAEEPASIAIPSELQEKISLSEALGGELYITDKIAIIGTDVMLENIKDPLKAGIRGYTVFRDGDMQGQPTGSWSVKFFVNKSEPKIGYIVHITPPIPPPGNATTKFKVVTPARKPSKDELVLFHAIRTAVDAIPDKVQPLNPVLMPALAIGEDGFLVYLLAGTKKDNTAVFGKHYRVVVSMDGRSASRVEPLTKTVLEVPIPLPKPDGTKPDLVVTHLLGDYPLETHVFTSLLHHKALYVGTEKYIWRINEGKISLVNLRKAAHDEALSAYKKGDYATANKKLRFLAVLGDSDAQWLVGSLYEFGKGVPKDFTEAARWYRYAAQLGNPVGEFRVGMMYQKGEGAPQDYAEASMWFRKSAEKGFEEAQLNLGAMCAKGQGVPLDYIQAHMWLSLAAAKGSADAQKELNSLAGRMSPSDIDEAQRLARDWKPKGKD